jgi:hypothetical protein
MHTCQREPLSGLFCQAGTTRSRMTVPRAEDLLDPRPDPADRPIAGAKPGHATPSVGSHSVTPCRSLRCLRFKAKGVSEPGSLLSGNLPGARVSSERKIESCAASGASASAWSPSNTCLRIAGEGEASGSTPPTGGSSLRQYSARRCAAPPPRSRAAWRRAGIQRPHDHGLRRRVTVHMAEFALKIMRPAGADPGGRQPKMLRCISPRPTAP